MSPEQADGMYGGLDERSDIYSMGGVLFAILTLRPPVSDKSVHAVLEKVRKGALETMTIPAGSVGLGTPASLARKVPEALRAVTYKAMACQREQRYATVDALRADIELYQAGFATAAEAASLARQVFLFVKRNRAATSLAAILLVGAVAFTVRLAASERRAHASAVIAEKASQEAVVNAKRADEQRLMAESSTRQALAEKEEARHAAADASIAQAIAAREMLNIETMQTVLSGVPPDLRSQKWHYLNHYLDSSERTISAQGASPWQTCIAHPQNAGVVLTLQEDNWIRSLDLNTGKTEDLLKLDGPIRSRHLAAVSPDATLIAVSRAPWTQVEILKLATGEKVSSFEAKNIKETAFKFRPNGKQLLKASREGRTPEDGLSLINVETGQMTGHQNMEHIYDADFGYGGGHIEVASAAHGYRTVSIGGLGAEAPANAAPFSGIKFPPLPRSSLVLSNGGIFYNLHDLIRRIEPTGKAIYDFRLPAKLKSGSDIYFYNKENLLVTLVRMSERSALLEIRNGTTGTPMISAPIVIDRNKGMDWKLLAHPISHHVAVFRGATMKVWKAKHVGDDVPFTNFNPYFSGMGFAFVGNSNQFVAVAPLGGGNFSIESGMLTPFGLEKTTFLSASEGGRLEAIRISSSRNTASVAIWTRDSKEGWALNVYGEQTESLVKKIALQKFNGIDRFALSPQGDRIWSGHSFYSATTGQILSTVDRSNVMAVDRNFRQSIPCWTDNEHVVEIAVLRNKSADGAEEDSERSMILWRASDARMMVSTPARNAVVLSASPDGLYLAEGGEDQCVRVRDAKTLQITRELLVHDAPVMDIAWHPSRPYVATVGEDVRLRIWDLSAKPGAELLEEMNLLEETPSRLYWSPDGQTLAVGGQTKLNFFTPKSCAIK